MDILIGATGFVGSNYMTQFPKTKSVTRADLYNLNRRIKCESLIIAAPSAEKWRANANPKEDLDSSQHLLDKIMDTFQPDRTLVFSTVDVYGVPVKVDETAKAEPLGAYGRNRLWFSSQLQSSLPSTTVIRLPGLFGPGLRKNIIFDILHNRTTEIAKINPASSFQWAEISWAVRMSKSYLDQSVVTRNLAVAPIEVSDIPIMGNWREQLSHTAPLVNYDVRTLEGSSGYLMSRDEVVRGLESWIGLKDVI